MRISRDRDRPQTRERVHQLTQAQRLVNQPKTPPDVHCRSRRTLPAPGLAQKFATRRRGPGKRQEYVQNVTSAQPRGRPRCPKQPRAERVAGLTWPDHNP